MATIAVTVNGRTFRLQCGDGEEPRLAQLAAEVQHRVSTIMREFGNIGDDRLFLMAALTLADELLDARAQAQTYAPTGLDPNQPMR